MIDDWLTYSRIILEPSWIQLSLLKSKDRRITVYDLDTVLTWLNVDIPKIERDLFINI